MNPKEKAINFVVKEAIGEDKLSDDVKDKIRQEMKNSPVLNGALDIALKAQAEEIIDFFDNELRKTHEKEIFRSQEFKEGIISALAKAQHDLDWKYGVEENGR